MQDIQINKIEIKKGSDIVAAVGNGMKNNKNLFISVGVVVVTVVAGAFLVASKMQLLPEAAPDPVNFVELKFTDKSLKFNYSGLSSDYVLPISSFEKGEGWVGDMQFDDAIVWDGNSSLLLDSRGNALKEAYLLKKMDMSKYQMIKVAVNLQSDPADLESVKLYFGNKDKSAYYYYPITNLVKGWNFLRIEKIKFSPFNAMAIDLASGSAVKKEKSYIDWGGIERVGLELTSRVNSTATVYFDSLIALQSEDYQDDWLATSPTFLNLNKDDKGQVMLRAKNYGGSVALVKKISGVSDFTFKAKVQPERSGARSGLFVRGDYKTGYGYYFLIDGVDGNRWQIQKTGAVSGKPLTEIVKNGIISNFMVEEKKPLWLKAEVKGKDLKFYLSTNGTSYTLLGQASDGDISQGGVGIAVLDAGVTEFDEFEFSQ